MKKSIITLALIATANNISAQKCVSTCLDNRINLNTGYNWSASTEYAAGSLDEYWQVTMLPSGTPAAYTPPYCAYVVSPASANFLWNEFSAPGVSQYITPFPNASSTVNNWTGGFGCLGGASGNPYRFERSFYVCDSMPVQASVNMSILSDDIVDKVWLDNTNIASFNFCPNNIPNYVLANADVVNYNTTLTPGWHRIKVDLRKVDSSTLGVNISGSIFATDYKLVANRCEPRNVCNNTCFRDSSTGLELTYTGSAGGYSMFSATVNAGSGNTIIGYEWNLPGQAPFVSHTSSTSETRSFFVPAGQTAVASVTAHAVNMNFLAGSSPCCSQTLTDTVTCTEDTTGWFRRSASQAGSENELMVYPNPASDQLTINAAFPLSAVTIIDAQGRRVKEWKTGAADRHVTLPVGSLAPGTYFVLVNNRSMAMFSKL